MKPETLSATVRRLISETYGSRACADYLAAFAFDGSAVAEEGGEFIPQASNLSYCLADLEEWQLEILRAEAPGRLKTAAALAFRVYKMNEEWHERQRKEKREGGSR